MSDRTEASKSSTVPGIVRYTYPYDGVGAGVGPGVGRVVGTGVGGTVGSNVGKGVGAKVGEDVGDGVGHACSKQSSCCKGFHAPSSSHSAGLAAMPLLQRQSRERDLAPLLHETEHRDHALGL